MDFPKLDNKFFNLDTYVYGSQYLQFSDYHKLLHGEVRKWYNIETLARHRVNIGKSDPDNSIVIDFYENYNLKEYLKLMYKTYPDINSKMLGIVYSDYIVFRATKVVVPNALKLFLDSIDTIQNIQNTKNYLIFKGVLDDDYLNDFYEQFFKLSPEHCYEDAQEGTHFYKLETYVCSIQMSKMIKTTKTMCKLLLLP